MGLRMKDSSLCVTSEASSWWAAGHRVLIRIINQAPSPIWEGLNFFNVYLVCQQLWLVISDCGTQFLLKLLLCWSSNLDGHSVIGTASKHRVPCSPQAHAAKTHGVCARDPMTVYFTSSTGGSGATNHYVSQLFSN